MQYLKSVSKSLLRSFEKWSVLASHIFSYENLLWVYVFSKKNPILKRPKIKMKHLKKKIMFTFNKSLLENTLPRFKNFRTLVSASHIYHMVIWSNRLFFEHTRIFFLRNPLVCSPCASLCPPEGHLTCVYLNVYFLHTHKVLAPFSILASLYEFFSILFYLFICVFFSSAELERDRQE